MIMQGNWQAQASQRWRTLLYPSGITAGDRAGDVAWLYGVRGGALLLGASLWVALVLATGVFSLAPLVLIGLAVGSAHRVLAFRYHRAHLPSALYIVLIGGVAANLFAGLAEFSARMGVDYASVLSAWRIPTDLPRLGSIFVAAFRVQDVAYYGLALVAALWCALHHRKTT